MALKAAETARSAVRAGLPCTQKRTKARR
jgi:hypothetical protein